MTQQIDEIPRPGEIGLTWIGGWTGVWVSLGQWLTGDGGLWPWRRQKKRLPQGSSGHAFALPRGYPTHVFWVLDDGVTIEAQPGGARVGHVSQYRDRQVLYSRLPLTDEQRSMVTAIGLGFEGTQYNFLAYVYLALWRFHVRPKWLRRKVQSLNNLICSQLCDKGLEQIGMNLFTDDRLNQDVTPGDLYGLLAQKGWW